MKRGINLRRVYPKIGRNEQCPCGSGKKFKHCCINGEWVNDLVDPYHKLLRRGNGWVDLTEKPAIPEESIKQE